jgi:ubiquinone/menaquinone biosynthesis C-methylase UbiE
MRHPGENAFNAVAKRQLHAAMEQAAARHATGRLLDIGCGLKPYAALFAPHVAEHVGVDHESSPHASTHVDVLADAYSIPLPDASFDTALMGELLEHLERPADGLAEAHRLLRPGGKLIVTTPFIWPLHEEPRDFFRYTPHGLRYLLAAAGFTDVDVQPLSGQWATIATLQGYALGRTRLGRPLARAIRAWGHLAERLDRRSPQSWMSWNHLAVAVRP